MFDAIVLWLHIMGAVVFVGPQIFLAAIAIPAIRTVQDAATRQEVTKKVTRGFGALGGVALGVLILTGLWNFKEAQDDGSMDITRYFITLQIKLTLVLVVVALTVLHGAVFGRKLQRLQAEGAPEEEVAKVRRWSMLISMTNLALSIIIIFCAALLGSQWSTLGGTRN